MQIEFINQTNDTNISMHSMSRDGLYGDGFFTTGLIKMGKFLHWDYHLERLLFSASRLYYTDFILETLRTSLEKLIKDIEHSAFRISVTRYQKKRGYGISESALSLCRLQLFPTVRTASLSCHLVFANTPISVNPYFAGIKHLNRLDNVLAASEIKSDDQETLMFNGETVVSGSRSNLFVLEEGEWYTPAIDIAGVNGITRLRILKVMEEHGIACNKSQISRGDLDNIEAAFICNSLIGVWPAKSINSKSLSIKPSLTIQELLND